MHRKVNAMIIQILILSFLIYSCRPKTIHADLSDCPLSTGFDFPVGIPDAKGYYNAQKFTENDHLGDDWNGSGGGNTDLGDSVFAASEGKVIFAEDVYGGWGNIVIIAHNTGTNESPEYIQSMYAHLDEIETSENNLVDRGQFIGTIGTAHEKYPAHLHFEIRSDVEMGIGGGYSSDTTGYLNPTKFILNHREIIR